jgi:very-short-patch-repair endonuclease
VSKEKDFPVAANVREELLAMADYIANSWYSDVIDEFQVNKIESPLEQIFYAYWKLGKYNEEFCLRPQFKIASYRVDFYVDPSKYFIEILKAPAEYLQEIPQIVIELDGHQWHEKDPIQVEKDKKRERAIVELGFTLLRYSGREMIQNPGSAVNDAYAKIGRLYKKFLLKKKGRS